jgi:zinc/manganese transport system ATP-binding protein
MRPVVELTAASLKRGTRWLWENLDLVVEPGEFVTVLGPNGSGKTSLLNVILGLLPLTSGSVCIDGRPARRGDKKLGYIPQRTAVDPLSPLRGRDLVALGLDGHRWGPPRDLRRRRRVVDTLLVEVGAEAYGNAPLGRLSGGEQQRLRVAQALATDPAVLLCDEPLLSLDLSQQRQVVDLLERRRREHGTAVLFVTHEINPVLKATDTLLYVMDGTFRLGSPDEVMTSAVLSDLYQTDIEVIRRQDRIIVIGADDEQPVHHHAHTSDL